MPHGLQEVSVPTIATAIAIPGIGQIQREDSLVQHILLSLTRSGEALAENDVLVIAQKVVSKSEGRQVRLVDVSPSLRAEKLASITGKDSRLIELILSESTEIIRVRHGLIITRHRTGLILANAGIDQSNIEQSNDDPSVLLLPKDPDHSCINLRRELRCRSGKSVAVVINDSVGRPWRLGTTGVAIGCAGITPLLDRRGEVDLFGRPMTATQSAIGDQVASMASLLQGECAEGRPVVILRGLSHALGNGTATDLVRPPQEDLFQ